jgi:hypothetical protein
VILESFYYYFYPQERKKKRKKKRLAVLLHFNIYKHKAVIIKPHHDVPPADYHIHGNLGDVTFKDPPQPFFNGSN